MTPEQEEQWKQAINPLDYLDFHALTNAGLLECAERLAGWGVPSWAAQLRSECVSMGLEAGTYESAWVHMFGMRSEIALVGIQILHPFDTDMEPIYQRLFVRFVQEALRPFVEWVMQHSDQLQHHYRPMIQLFELCKSFALPIDDTSVWFAEWRLFLSEHLPLSESDDVLGMLSTLLRVAYTLLNPKKHRSVIPASEVSWESARAGDLKEIIALLNRQHQWRLDGLVGKDFPDGANHIQLIADVYLTTLEAECPPPDWLQSCNSGQGLMGYNRFQDCETTT